jgi:nitrogen-specific signal transduction histidine kinase
MKTLTFGQDLLENGPVMFLLVDDEKRIVHCNKLLQENCNCKLGEYNLYNIFNKKCHETLDKNMNGQNASCTLTLHNNIIVKANVSAVKEKDKIKYFKFYMYDVTKYYDKYELIFDIGGIGVWHLDTNSNDIYWSNGMKKLFDAKKVKNYDEFLSLINIKERKRVGQLIKEGIKKKSFDLMFKLNTEKYISMKCKVGESTGILTSVCFDITDKVESTQRMNDSMQKLEQNNEELEQFAYIASHDLREPLMGIAGFASLIKRRYKDSRDKKDNYILDSTGFGYIDTIIDSCNRMSAKIDDLLLLSRSARGDFNKVFNLNDSLEEAKTNLNGKLARSQVQISVIGKLPDVIGSQSMVAQVFQNIIENALKYRKTDETPKIEIKMHELNGMYKVSIRDNGIGFDQKHERRIFTAFQRLHTANNYSGTGIGLAIVKKIIDKHGGEVWATSELDIGSVFNFTLKKP